MSLGRHDRPGAGAGLARARGPARARLHALRWRARGPAGPRGRQALRARHRRLGRADAALAPFAFSAQVDAEQLEAFVAKKSGDVQSREGYRGQIAAVLAHDTYDRLPGIECTTLILTGDDDRVIPGESSGVLAQRIGGSRLEVDRRQRSPVLPRTPGRDAAAAAGVPGLGPDRLALRRLHERRLAPLREGDLDRGRSRAGRPCSRRPRGPRRGPPCRRSAARCA